MSDCTGNPFAGLLQQPTESEPTSETLENIFGFTLNCEKKHLVYLSDLSKSFSTNALSLENVDHALFERILLRNPESYIDKVDNDLCETKVIIYLFNCFTKAEEVQDDDLKNNIRNLIMQNVVTSLKQPELHEGQDVYQQFYDVVKNENTILHYVYNTFRDDSEPGELIESFSTVLKKLHMDVAKATPVTFPTYTFGILNVYVSNEDLAMILLNYCQPKSADVGSSYADTLFGAILSISSLPKVPNGSYDFFQDPLDQASNVNVRSMLWISANRITQDFYQLILNLLKCSKETRCMILTWFGNCLKGNVDRGKLWNTHIPDFNPSNFNTVSDGFMINFIMVLLRLCWPFSAHNNIEKILKVDPTYCAVANDECPAKEIHLLDMSKETCLIPCEELQERPTSTIYNFVTECFFMEHRALDLGFRVINEKLVRLNQEMSRIERAYQEAVNQAGPMNEIADSIKQRMSSELSKYLSIKCVMSEPTFQEMLFSFIIASAHWLNQVAVHVDYETSKAPMELKEVSFPLPVTIPDTLKCIPEFIVENIVCYLIFIRRFNPNLYEEHGYERLKPLLTFILVYMSSSKYTKNPHLRAHLAEALEALLPCHKDEPPELNTLGGTQRERLFKEHEHRGMIVEILLNVFVGIEMTGENVQFEQKFNYRRPMYMVMDYLWEIPDYQQCFLKLAQDAEDNMEVVPPPIFLRFINLLINDAIFLLDESLSNMAKLREIQTTRDAGEWDRLPVQERAQNMGHLQHIGMLARFDNILGRDTIRTIEYLTSKITIVFSHSTMVDRVAAMLNYFLLNLVGPNQKNFKVKDAKEYNFDPAATVLDICKIYVNLKESDSFCLAISQDGRSYSPQLFTLAEDVLVRIGGGILIGELQDVAKKVLQKSAEYETNEIAVSEAPDHFLDPIMSTLMTDPVILPSSKQIVDRSTIARHLLSDQTDPFNRAPLSMDQIIPNTQLAEEIKAWMDERKIKR
ncbi:hypothetical protein FQR65_LT15000 [Abscondita terminalis]|nr:hypothetical protein FQR65_LT15000 [Abscondita terminalis]